MKMKLQLASLVLVVLLGLRLAHASDADDLAGMLDEFLANAHEAPAHAAFWADDLVYTSSDGSRFGKSEIMAGFDDAASSGDEDAAAQMAYSSEDVDIRVYGDTAIVAFKLVGKPLEDESASGPSYYFNTGTFLRRGGVWQVVAWQATRIPPQ